MVPKVFLSLSGKDDDFVGTVWRHLPEGLAVFYRKTFRNGDELLTAMENAVSESSVFVFFASRSSLDSHWVSFEIDRARLSKVQRPHLRILVFPLSNEIDPSMLPAWMQEFWIPRAGHNPKDIARYIRNALLTSPIGLAGLTIPVIGRGQLLDQSTRRMMTRVTETGNPANVMIFSGVSGIGRRTFARYFLAHTFPAIPELGFGPELQLPQFSDLADIYRALRDQIETKFSLKSFEKDLAHFRTMSTQRQVAEVAQCLMYFADLGQSVTANTGSGLFEDRGDLKSWVPILFEELDSKSKVKLCLISNRQIREENLHAWGNVVQFHVPPLNDPDVQALMTATSTVLSITPTQLSSDLIRSIGGHPQIAKATIRLIAQRGPRFFDRDPRPFFSIQEEILSESLQLPSLTSIQQEVLCLLSWVPQLDGRLIESVISKRENVSQERIVEAMDNLVLGCLALVVENGFMISSAIRHMFRRMYGYGPEGLLGEFSRVMQAAWNESIERNDFDANLFDAFVFMHSLEGRSLPRELEVLLLPSTLREVVNEAYARGRDDDDTDSLRRVISWGKVADKMKMDEAVREEILSSVARAHIRLREYSEAEAVLRGFDKRGYRSASFLRGFALRRQAKYREAIPFLREALADRKWDRSTVQELATCYQKLGMRRELSELVHRHESIVERSASLLDFRIGMLISAGRFRDAEAAIRRLISLPEDEGRGTIRQAQILIQRDHAFAKAEDLLSGLVTGGIGNPVTVRRWRAIAAINANHLAAARRDIEFIRARPGREATAQRLEIYYATKEGKYDAAQEIFNTLRDSEHDDLLMATILEARASDVLTPLSEKESLRKKALELRARNRSMSEFDFEFD